MEQQLEERDEIVGLPLARGEGLAEPELPSRGDAREERPVADLERHRCPRAEAAARAVGEDDLERAALEVGERALEHGDRGPLEQPAARARLGSQRPLERAHPRTEPSPATNGGLRWNGTRFSQSRSASQWMSAITWSGISG